MTRAIRSARTRSPGRSAIGLTVSLIQWRGSTPNDPNFIGGAAFASGEYRRFARTGSTPCAENCFSTTSMVVRTASGRFARTVEPSRREAFSWDDMQWIRALWKGLIVIKGVLSADDAKRSLDRGAAAVVVSNHGGRQLDAFQRVCRFYRK